MAMKILAIETSCDETAICLMDISGKPGADLSRRILGNALLSQAALHAQYGGVFPNLAKREHEHNLVPLLTEALRQAGALQERAAAGGSCSAGIDEILAREPELARQLREFAGAYEAPGIDAIAVTQGPGLEPALWVGINFAKALALLWQKPLVAVNHLEGHIAASALAGEGFPTFPALALLVSGGHTELVFARGFGDYSLLGSTRDDAAGECFDKCARLLELPYPGGPEISRLASEARERALPRAFVLPRPMIDSPDLEFSFSGLKTAVRRTCEKHGPMTGDEKRAMAREIEDAIVDVLVKKTIAAQEEHDARSVIVGGGVSANTHLRAQLAEAARERDMPIFFPPKGLATDNAVMIALAGYLCAAKGRYSDPQDIVARGDLPLTA